MRLFISLLFSLSLLLSCASPSSGVEKPPLEYQSGSISSTYVYSNHVNKLCSEKLGRLYNGQYFEACYVPGEDLIILPTHWWPELKEHEEGHARGWRHIK